MISMIFWNYQVKKSLYNTCYTAMFVKVRFVFFFDVGILTDLLVLKEPTRRLGTIEGARNLERQNLKNMAV